LGSPRAHIHVVALGGTITMVSRGEGGIVPTLTGADLLRAVPGLEGIARLTVETPFMAPGASLSFAQLRAAGETIARALAEGADGVVVVQGTDTIEETAFLFDLGHSRAEPVVVTGAMRGAEAPGADGPGNLLAAVATAGSRAARDLGVLVVLNDEIHAARFVSKAHSGPPSAFASPGAGPLGRVIEGAAQIGLVPTRRESLGSMPELPRVAVVKLGLGDDGEMIGLAMASGCAGLVIEGMGVGHVPEAALAAIDSAVAEVPVVLATRVPAGPIFERTYGFAGSERDLIARGLIPAGILPAHKARLLLAYLLGLGVEPDAVAPRFRALSRV
jgi:L-asparaginase